MLFTLDLFRNDKRVDTMRFTKRRASIGSSPKCDIVIRSFVVDAEQAVLIYREGQVHLRESGRKALVTSAGAFHKKIALALGDSFTIDNTRFIVSALAASEPKVVLDDANVYAFSPYPSKIQDFNLQGEKRGTHFIELDGRSTLYRARLFFDQILPECELIQNSLLWTTDLPKQEISLKAASKFKARSNALRFSEEILTLTITPKDFKTYHALWDEFVSVLSYPRDAQTLICLDVVVDDDKKLLAAAIDLAKIIAKNGLRIVEEGRTYMRVETHASKGENEVHKEDAGLQILIDELDALSTHLSGHSQRVGEAIETRLLDDEVPEFSATLHTAFKSSALDVFDLRFFGALPKGGELAELVPQEKGMIAFFQRWGEFMTGDEVIDKAFVINADKNAQGLLDAMAFELRAFGEQTSSISINENRLSLMLSCTRSDLNPMVSLVFKAWNRALRYRLKVS